MNDQGPAPEGVDETDGAHRIPALLVDGVVCLALMGCGLWFVVSAAGLPTGRSFVTPATFPTATGLLLIACSALQVAISFRSRNTAEPVPIERPLAVVIGMVLMLALPEAVDRLSFYPVIVVWTLVFGWIAGMRSLVHIALTLAVILGVARFVFEMLLGTPLP